MPAENLRRYPRRTLRLPARLELGWGTLEGTIENMGEGGAFFVTDTLEGAVAEGDRLRVLFEAPEGMREVPGAVLRVERYFHEGELFRAFAIKFDRP